jgi:drug/metabolite transporter (DMT)-like permease
MSGESRTKEPSLLTSNPRVKGNLLMLAASMIWGFAFVGQRSAAEFVGAYTFNTLRFLLGTLVLVAVIAVLNRVRHVSRERRRAALRKVVVPGILTGTVLTVAVGLQQVAMETTEAGKAAFLTGFYMVLVPVVGIFRGHRLTWKIVAGVVLGFTGLYFISVKGDFSIATGDLLLLATSLLWTVHILLIDYYVPKMSALRFSAAQFLTTTVQSAVLALILDPAPFTGMENAMGELLYTGILSVGVAYTFQVMGQRHSLPSHAALILCTESLWGAVGGALILGEKMDWRGYLGALLLITGIVISQLGSVPQTPKLDHPDAKRTRPPKWP